MIIVTRPTSSLPARGVQRAAAPAPQQEQRSAHHSVTSYYVERYKIGI